MSPDDKYYASIIRSVLRMMPDDVRRQVLGETFALLDDEAAEDLRAVIRAEEVNRGVDYGI